jgi:iron complex outermembrane receptor protein
MDKWKGLGQQNQQQINFNLVQPVGRGEITGFINHSERRENDYQDMSLEQIARLGRDFDNISDNYALAVRIADIANNRGDTGAAVTNAGAGTVYPAPIGTVDDAYFDAAGLRDDTLGALTLNYPVTDAFEVSLTGYGHKNEGQGLWGTPYTPTPGGAPLSIRTTEYDIDRFGFTSGLTFDFGSHSLNAGLWYEDNDFNQARRFYGEASSTTPSRSFEDFQTNPFFTQWDYQFKTKTSQLYLQDTWMVADSLKANFGFKSVKVKNRATCCLASGASSTGTSVAEVA